MEYIEEMKQLYPAEAKMFLTWLNVQGSLIEFEEAVRNNRRLARPLPSEFLNYAFRYTNTTNGQKYWYALSTKWRRYYSEHY